MQVSFQPYSGGFAADMSSQQGQPFTKIGLVGAGDVAKNRIAPALNAIRCCEYPEMDVAICSLETKTPIDNLPHKYYQSLPGNLLPLDDLYADGFLSNETLWIVVTPPDTHIPITLQLAGMCGRLAIEKPLATDSRHARALLPSFNQYRSLYPLDHKLFAAGSFYFLNQCRERPILLKNVCRVEGLFLESAGFLHNRAQENGIFDIQWHMFMLVIAAFKNLGRRFEIGVESVQVARHRTDPSGTFSDAATCTASNLSGTLAFDKLQVSYEFRQAKGAPRNEKHVRFFDPENNLLVHVDLGESGWQAHRRMLETLMSPGVDMRHTLTDAIALTDLLSCASAIAEEDIPYEFGTLPSFMNAPYSIRLPQLEFRGKQQLKFES